MVGTEREQFADALCATTVAGFDGDGGVGGGSGIVDCREAVRKYRTTLSKANVRVYEQCTKKNRSKHTHTLFYFRDLND